MKKSNVAVDADGVVLDFLTRFELAAKECLGRVIVRLNTEYDLGIRYGLTEHEVNQVWEHFHNAAHWKHIPIIPGAAQAIAKLQEQHHVHLVTAIDLHLHESRRFNLLTHGIDNITIHCTGHKESKLGALRALAPVVYFDDHPKHIEEAFHAGIEHRIIIDRDAPYPSEHATGRFQLLHEAVDWFVDHMARRPKRGILMG